MQVGVCVYEGYCYAGGRVCMSVVATQVGVYVQDNGLVGCISPAIEPGAPPLSCLSTPLPLPSCFTILPAKVPIHTPIAFAHPIVYRRHQETTFARSHGMWII